MRFDPSRHHRRSIRLPGYDYTQAGAYFVTICAQDRACLFGAVRDGAMQVNALGEIVWALKTFSARRINEHRRMTGTPVWQRNYYEHIIRHERAYDRIAAYIDANPRRWAADTLHPRRRGAMNNEQ